MNLILLYKEDFIDGTNRTRLQGRRLKHVLEVHRASVGDELRVGLCGENIGKGLVTLLNSNVLEMDVHWENPPPAPLPVTLVLALPRPKVLKRVLQTASTMGVKKIFLLNAFRVEKSFWKSPVLNEKTLGNVLALGLEQAVDTIMPEVLLRPLFKPFVEDELPDIIRGTVPIVAHPYAPEACPCGIKGKITVAIGPEGGFIPYEIEKLVSCGFMAVNLGERVLRVETALPVLLSKLF